MKGKAQAAAFTRPEDWIVLGAVLLALVFSGALVIPQSVAATPAHCGDGDVGAFLYLNHPDSLMRGIRVAEGVPSYGVMYLKEHYGSHGRVPAEEGRRAAAKIVHEQYSRWRSFGCPGTFLDFLSDTYAPVGARNDPYGLNKHWQDNVLINAAMHAERRGR